MGADEEGTLERLKALRRELVDPKIAEHRGRSTTPSSRSRGRFWRWCRCACGATSRTRRSAWAAAP
jgi:hypothetical protein